MASTTQAVLLVLAVPAPDPTSTMAATMEATRVSLKREVLCHALAGQPHHATPIGDPVYCLCCMPSVRMACTAHAMILLPISVHDSSLMVYADRGEQAAAAAAASAASSGLNPKNSRVAWPLLPGILHGSAGARPGQLLADSLGMKAYCAFIVLRALRKAATVFKTGARQRCTEGGRQDPEHSHLCAAGGSGSSVAAAAAAAASSNGLGGSSAAAAAAAAAASQGERQSL